MFHPMNRTSDALTDEGDSAEVRPIQKEVPALFKYALLVILAAAVALTAGDCGDFHFFYDAAARVWCGHSPYTVAGYYSPLHLLIYTLPLALLPYSIAFRVNAFLAALVLLFVFRRWARGSALSLVMLCAAPWLIMIVWYGQIEWLLALASIMTPIPALFLLLLKPQLGWLAGVILVLLLWRRNRRVAVLTCMAILAIFGASYLAGMRWTGLNNAAWNTAIFPLGLLLAAPLVFYALRKSRVDAALAAAPALSPYVSPFGWLFVMPFIAQHRFAVIVFAALSWLIVLAWRAKLLSLITTLP